jgi:predicted peptidase
MHDMRCKKFTLLVPALVLIMSVSALGEEPEPGKQIACQLTVKTPQGDNTVEKTIHYWLFVPADYASQKSYPLMVFLHGAGERGDDLEAVKKWGPPKIVAEKPDFPFVLVSPQCPREVRWDIDLIAQLTEHVAGELKIDKQRMYITGLSMGGMATWRLLAKYPKLYAAAVPICGGGDPAQAAKMKQVPIWAFHGDADKTVPVTRSKEMVDAVNQAGGSAKLTVYPGVGHNSWSETYANPEVYKWLLSHKRD